MIPFVLASILFIASSGAFASDIKANALKYVPGGTIVQEKLKEVKIQTPQGSVVEVEFDSSGKFEEASGDNLEKDVFQPEGGPMTLKAAVESVKTQGKSPTGDWSLEKSLLRGWHYEFEGLEKGQKYDYVVDATSGKIIESQLDD